MPTADEVIVEFEARVGGYEADLNRARQTFERTTRAQESRMQAFERRMTAMGGRVAAALATIVTVETARQFLQIADSAKQIEAQLKLATRGFGSFSKAQADVRRIAGETRGGLVETAALYGNFARATKELGADQEAAARAVETFSKTLKISGAGANEAASATLQFGQALAAGALRGDELNSILEASPRLARLLTESMGVPIGQIKKLGEEGKLTSDKLLEALTNKKFTAGIDEEFKQLPVTFDEAMQQVSNAAIITFGAFDRGGQFSTTLANFITDGTRGFADLEASAERFGATVASEFAGISAIFNNAITELKAFKAVLDSIGGNGAVDRALSITGDVLDPLGTIIRASPAYQKGRDAKAGELALQRIMRADPVAQYLAQGGKLPAAPTPKAAPRGGTTEKKKTGGRGSRGPKGRDPEDIRQQFNQELLSYWSRIASADADSAMNAEEAAEYERKQVEYARRASLNSLKHDKDYSEAQKKQLKVALDDAADAELDRIEREKARRLEQEASDRLAEIHSARMDELRLQYDLSDTQADRKSIALKIVEAEQEHLRTVLETVIASKSESDATKERARIALAALNARAGAERDSAARRNETAAERYMRDLNKTPAQINEALDDIKINGLEALNDGLTDAIVNFKSLGDVAKSVIQSILSDLIRLQIQQAIIKPLAGMIGGLGGGMFGGGGPSASLVSSASKTISSFDFFAKGTNFAPGGYAVVGEEGPELVNLPRGAKVIPNHRLTLPGGLMSATGRQGAANNDNRSFTINASFPNVTNSREARQTERQLTATMRNEIGKTTRRGM